MDNCSELTDEQFAAAFADCSLPPELFNHEAHLRLAWIHLKASGRKEATDNVCTQIAAFARHYGAKDKYHHTLTVAAVNIVHHFMQKGKAANFTELLHEFPQLKTKFTILIGSHYSADILQSDRARAGYLAPDLLPFNFGNGPG